MPSPETTSPEPIDVDAIIEVLERQVPEEIVAIAEQAHPGDVEQAFERLDDPLREQILDQLPVDVLSEWSDHLPAADVERLLNTLPVIDQREVLDSLSDDELVDLLQEMEEEDRPQFIELLPEDKRQISEDLMQYPEETAGGRMTTAMATVVENLTVKEALDELRAVRDEAEILSRIFVVDDERRILGLFRLRDLAFSPWDTPIRELMEVDLVSIDAMADQEEAANMVSRYDLMALPVVDAEKRLVGVITHDDAFEILEQESTEDMELMGGIGRDRGEQAYLQVPVLSHFKRRAGWVVVLAFLALTSGWVLHAYEEVLTAYYILAIYLPMVVAAGGNTGAQSATMVIRAMSVGELDTRELGRVLWKEGRIGVLLGCLLGLCVALQINFLMAPSLAPEGLSLFKVGLVVGFSLIAQIVFSTLIGAFLPIMAKKAKLDPAVVASPAITTFVDVTGAIIYFTLAAVIFGL